MKKIIAVNTRFLLKDKMEGIGYFTHETMRYIVTANTDYTFYFLFDRPYSKEFIYSNNVKPVVLFPPARHPFLFIWWFEWSVCNWMNSNRPDLFISPDGFGVLRSNVPQLLVMHDIAYEHYPTHNKFLQQKYYEFFMPRFAAKAKRIATVSQHSKNDLIQYYSVPEEKIDVVYSAVKEDFYPVNDKEKELTQNKYAQGFPYFVYTGSVNPRKNLQNMLKAYDLFRKKTGEPFRFVIAGAKGWKTSQIIDIWKQMEFKNEVLFTGRLPLDELRKVVGSAFALLYVSLYEGFGVPPLEAMACKVPAIISSTSSMPEICGEAALQANPESPEEISRQMLNLYVNPDLRGQLIEKGSEQFKKYSWQKTAQLLWNSCIKALELS
ncbi:MAG: glycosyltransferase family 1 protein [Chitinophagales bacterium]|nr:glycosyltransferase family 1 protein [Chitinophagales bacterium]